jgi:hypothetical protein
MEFQLALSRTKISYTTVLTFLLIFIFLSSFLQSRTFKFIAVGSFLAFFTYLLRLGPSNSQPCDYPHDYTIAYVLCTLFCQYLDYGIICSIRDLRPCKPIRRPDRPCHLPKILVPWFRDITNATQIWINPRGVGWNYEIKFLPKGSNPRFPVR